MQEPWFKEGLRFKCTGCGKCCTGSPGYVFLSPPDLTALATHFKLTEEEFKSRYTWDVEGQLSLVDTPGSNACVFLKDNKCTAYEARPVQCRTFPWWLHNLRGPADWKEAGKRCEGINHPEAPIVDANFIAQECMTYLDNIIEQNFGAEYS